jgi:hypothetical protein
VHGDVTVHHQDGAEHADLSHSSRPSERVTVAEQATPPGSGPSAAEAPYDACMAGVPATADSVERRIRELLPARRRRTNVTTADLGTRVGPSGAANVWTTG